MFMFSIFSRKHDYCVHDLVVVTPCSGWLVLSPLRERGLSTQRQGQAL